MARTRQATGEALLNSEDPVMRRKMLGSNEDNLCNTSCFP
jgi:hypothetical protein